MLEGKGIDYPKAANITHKSAATVAATAVDTLPLFADEVDATVEAAEEPDA